jgi:hypothetical protein
MLELGTTEDFSLTLQVGKLSGHDARSNPTLSNTCMDCGRSPYAARYWRTTWMVASDQTVKMSPGSMPWKHPRYGPIIMNSQVTKVEATSGKTASTELGKNTILIIFVMECQIGILSAVELLLRFRFSVEGMISWHSSCLDDQQANSVMN